MRRIQGALVLALTAVAALALGPPVQGHSPSYFDACVAYKKTGGYCGDTATYTPYSYDKVHLRGKVRPRHSSFEAKVMRRAPGSNNWVHVATVPIGGLGRMHWGWEVKESHVDYDGPYKLKFLIQGHGQSDVVRAWVIYGE